MTDYDSSFEKLWTIYPKRNGKKTKKPPAYKKWLALSLGEKAALFSSVERNNRDKSWGAYIRDLVTYINQGGWEDEVEPEKPQQRTYHYAEPPHPCTKWEALANRLFLRYLRRAGGLSEDKLKRALHIKNQVIAESSQAFDEEMAGNRESQTDAVWSFANLFIGRLDLDLGYSLKDQILRA